MVFLYLVRVLGSKDQNNTCPVSIRYFRVRPGHNIVAQIGETFSCVAAVRAGRGFYCCIAITIVRRMSIALFIAAELGVGGRGDTSTGNNAGSG